MADDHRRVEPREMAIGMRSDPERIQGLIDERERRERASRPKQGHSFGEVLAEVPADAEPEPEPDADAEGGDAVEEAEPDLDRPKVPPDPRMAALHRMLDGGAQPAKEASAPQPIELDAPPAPRAEKRRRRPSKKLRGKE